MSLALRPIYTDDFSSGMSTTAVSLTLYDFVTYILLTSDLDEDLDADLESDLCRSFCWKFSRQLLKNWNSGNLQVTKISEPRSVKDILVIIILLKCFRRACLYTGDNRFSAYCRSTTFLLWTLFLWILFRRPGSTRGAGGLAFQVTT